MFAQLELQLAREEIIIHLLDRGKRCTVDLAQASQEALQSSLLAQEILFL